MKARRNTQLLKQNIFTFLITNVSDVRLIEGDKILLYLHRDEIFYKLPTLSLGLKYYVLEILRALDNVQS